MVQIISLIILWLCLGASTAYFANQRGRDPFVWFMIGMLLGFFGMLLLFLLPPVADAQQKMAPFEEKGEEFIIQNRDYLIKEWYYYDQDRVRQGPLTFDQVKALWKRGVLNEESFVWSEGLESWKKIEELQNVYTHLQLV